MFRVGAAAHRMCCHCGAVPFCCPGHGAGVGWGSLKRSVSNQKARLRGRGWKLKVHSSRTLSANLQAEAPAQLLKPDPGALGFMDPTPWIQRPLMRPAPSSTERASRV